MANNPQLTRLARMTGGEMNFEEIGEELGIRPQTARAIFTNGMRKLRMRFPQQLRALLNETKEMRR